ncbi:HAD family hydrolase [Kitasatospora acidiphila]|uniref:HAD family hydrolase n=1 Tax=Kitasatospora acidiphila TaxID=2567942 RepID=UPI0015F0293D|nr:HAD family hydrolase [Kitasatospora acidiphila]
MVILDLDGTLTDEHGNVERAFTAAGEVAHKHAGIDAGRFAEAARATAQQAWWDEAWIDPLSDAFGLSAWDGLSEDFTGTVPALDQLRSWLPDLRRHVWSLALQEFGISNARLTAAVGDTYIRHRHEDVRLLPGAAELVEQLGRDRRLVILSNGPADGQRRKLAVSGLQDLVLDAVISTEVGFAKPDPRAVALAVHRAGGNTDVAIVIGDTYDRDVLGALACHVPAIWICGQEGQTRPANSSVTAVDSTGEVLGALQALEESPG